MERRSFFGKVMAAVAAVMVGKTIEAKADEGWKPLDSGDVLRVFKRADKNGYQSWDEIPWDDMRAGDEVLIFGCRVGHPLTLEGFVVTEPPQGKTGSTGIDKMCPLLKKLCDNFGAK